MRIISLRLAFLVARQSLSSSTGGEFKSMIKIALRANGASRKVSNTSSLWTTIPKSSPPRKKESKVASI